MNLINILRKNVLYFFISIPFVIVLYELLMAITTGNRGYTILLLFQITVVPITITLLNSIFINGFLTDAFFILFILAVLGLLIYLIYMMVTETSK